MKAEHGTVFDVMHALDIGGEGEIQNCVWTRIGVGYAMEDRINISLNYVPLGIQGPMRLHLYPARVKAQTTEPKAKSKRVGRLRSKTHPSDMGKR